MSNWRRFAIVSDIHGDQQDPRAVSAFHSFCGDYKPQISVLAGDLWDFRPLRKKAEPHEREQSMRDDMGAGLEFLHQFKPQVFTLGNHDVRLWRLASESHGVIADFAKDAVSRLEKTFQDAKCTILPYDKRKGV